LKKYLNDRTINDIKTEKEGEDYYTSEKFFSFEKIVQKYSKKK
jgi:hypothetical protein